MQDAVGLELQKLLDNGNCVNYANIKESEAVDLSFEENFEGLVSGTKVIIDSKKLFNRLTVIGERELEVESCLQYELTPLPMALFRENQFMRKPDKANLSNQIKKQGTNHGACSC